MSSLRRVLLAVGIYFIASTLAGCSGFQAGSAAGGTAAGSGGGPGNTGIGWTSLLGDGSDTEGRNVAVDLLGNVYMTGWTNGGLDGNSAIDVVDLYLTKYDNTGAKQWTKQLGATGIGEVGQEVATEASGITVDTAGNVYLVGVTTGNFQGNTLGGLQDSFLAKFDSNGTLQWSKQWGCGNNCMGCPSGLVVDTENNIYTIDSEWSASTTVITSIMKFDSTGNLTMTQAINSSASAEGRSVAVDAQGNIFVTGWTYGGLNGNTLVGTQDGFLAKYNSTGAVQWTKEFGVANTLTGSEGVALDSAGNIYITGSTTGGLNGNTLQGSRNLYITKFTPAGSAQWTKQLGEPGTGTAVGDTDGHAISVDSNNNVIVAGDTDVGLGGFQFFGTNDYILVSYDAQGNQQWLKQFGASAPDSSASYGYTWGYGLALDLQNNAYIVGTTNAPLDGSPAPGIAAYVTKYVAAAP